MLSEQISRKLVWDVVKKQKPEYVLTFFFCINFQMIMNYCAAILSVVNVELLLISYDIYSNSQACFYLMDGWNVLWFRTAQTELSYSTQDQNGLLATMKIILKFRFFKPSCCATLVWWKHQELVSILIIIRYE